jgi:3-oxoacyl-[acyl-carrier protein] reductase
MIDPKLENKVALITGANHGIGAETAKRLAAQGAKVFISSYTTDSPYTVKEMTEALKKGIGGWPLYFAMQQQSAEVVVNDIRSRGGIAVAKEYDLGEADNIARLFDACEAEFGAVDILIINHTHCVYETFDPASVTHEPFGIHLTSTESIDHHFAVNARAPALMMREYLQRYLARKTNYGRIISLTTTIAHKRNISYASSKNALVSYSLSAAQEMGKYGITVNVVCPGATQTGHITPENELKINNETPLGRLGMPEDIADVMVFLTSEQARWVTGQLIYASGGFNVNK